jgi:hypothetical protein
MRRITLSTLLLACGLAVAGCHKLPRSMEPTPPPSADVLAQLWVEPTDLATRDLFLGPGGAEWAPADGARFTFVEKDTAGFSWGWDVKDERDVQWSAKYGPEAQPEVVVSRLAWAMGYHQPPTYYVPRWELAGSTDVPQPSRFRPLPPGWTKRGPWELHRNPFVGTTPYNGLLALMRIVNNWDLLDRNTETYDIPGGRDGATRWYVLQDLGASLGRTKVIPDSGSRNDIEDFEQQGFVRGVKRGEVEWDDLGRSHRGLYDHIPAADLVWIAERLDRLSEQQWNDAFRAAGYEPALAARFIRKIRANVAAARALPLTDAAPTD